jgi:hypothetical protein
MIILGFLFKQFRCSFLEFQSLLFCFGWESARTSETSIKNVDCHFKLLHFAKNSLTVFLMASWGKVGKDFDFTYRIRICYGPKVTKDTIDDTRQCNIFEYMVSIVL